MFQKGLQRNQAKLKCSTFLFNEISCVYVLYLFSVTFILYIPLFIIAGNYPDKTYLIIY